MATAEPFLRKCRASAPRDPLKEKNLCSKTIVQAGGKPKAL